MSNLMNLLKKQMVTIITAISGIFVILSYFLDVGFIDNCAAILMNWAVIIFSVSFGLGIINLSIIHGGNIKNRKSGVWPFSLWLLFGMFFMIIVGLISKVPAGSTSGTWTWLYTWVVIPCMQSVMSIFGFAIISASIHSFKVRNVESGLMMLSALIMFLWNAPIGGSIWSGISELGTWISTVPTAGAFRGVTIGMGLGVISLGIRIFIGKEKTSSRVE